MAKVNFDDANGSSSTIQAQYMETMYFDYGQGIPSLPYSNLGIQRQSELLFQKDVSEVIQNTEVVRCYIHNSKVICAAQI